MPPAPATVDATVRPVPLRKYVSADQRSPVSESVTAPKLPQLMRNSAGVAVPE